MMNDLLEIMRFVTLAVWNVWPAFLISVLLGVLIRALKLDGAIRSAFSVRVGLSIVLATMVGAFSRFCSCTVIPIVSGLLVSGVPLAPVMAFWIASPTMDPEIFALSVATLGWPLALIRLGSTLILSLGAGFLTLALTRSGIISGSMLRRQVPADSCCAAMQTVSQPVPQPTFALAGNAAIPLTLAPATVGVSVGATCSSGGCSTATPRPSTTTNRWWAPLSMSLRELDWRRIGRDVATQSWSLGRWLLLAFVLEALITLYVPQAAIAGLLGSDSGLAVPFAALIGIPLYLSNITALPIVSGLLAQGMEPGAAITFLVAGPVTTIPAMTAVWGIVQRRIFALYLGIGVLGAMLMGILTNLVLR